MRPFRPPLRGSVGNVRVRWSSPKKLKPGECRLEAMCRRREQKTHPAGGLRPDEARTGANGACFFSWATAARASRRKRPPKLNSDLSEPVLVSVTGTPFRRIAPSLNILHKMGMKRRVWPLGMGQWGWPTRSGLSQRKVGLQRLSRIDWWDFTPRAEARPRASPLGWWALGIGWRSAAAMAAQTRGAALLQFAQDSQARQPCAPRRARVVLAAPRYASRRCRVGTVSVSAFGVYACRYFLYSFFSFLCMGTNLPWK